tara:strand:+ start:11356 stop:12471 length:1116 start_codon:yes stop_codon:yes gene_type:complete
MIDFFSLWDLTHDKRGNVNGANASPTRKSIVRSSTASAFFSPAWANQCQETDAAAGGELLPRKDINMQETLRAAAPATLAPPYSGRPAYSAFVDEDQIALRQVHIDPQSVLCTIVGLEGSFSRRLGGQLAISPAGLTFGSLSDGCLEKELATQALALKVRGSGPVCLRFGKGSPFIDFRLPCGSGLDILIDPDPAPEAVGGAVARLDARLPASLSLASRADFLARRGYIPSLRLVICGAGPEVEWLSKLAASLGVAAVVVGPDRGLHLNEVPEWLSIDRWTAITLLFHDHEWERAILEWSLASEAFYIGAMGGKKARDTRNDFLAAAGVSERQISRIRSPIGLIKKARDAHLLALSVLSEIVQDYEALRTC